MNISSAFRRLSVSRGFRKLSVFIAIAGEGSAVVLFLLFRRTPTLSQFLERSLVFAVIPAIAVFVLGWAIEGFRGQN
jgi:hypothetical protein